jgi:FlaA1/EpsC-like NDP-sugar epimerase
VTPPALLIGQAATLRALERQLDGLADRPVTLGWVVVDPAEATRAARAGGGEPILGHVGDLEAIVARRPPGVALVSLPAVMTDLVTGLRTRLRRLGVPDRFLPTLEDQLAGVGPRTHLDVDLAALVDRPARVVDEPAVRGVVGGRRVLITGAGGSIGGELARIVARHDPAHLLLMDRSENALFEIDRQVARRHATLPRQAVLHDVVDAAGTLDHCRRATPEVIFHAAAHKHVPIMEDHPGAAVDNNLFGTKAIVDAAHEVGTERFVMISTDKAVNPSSIMGATKRLAELYVQHVNRTSPTACSIVRFGNVLGSSGSVLETWSRQIADGGPITVTDRRMTRYFMTIPEAAALVIESAALVDPAAPAGEVFLLDMGDPLRIVDLAERFVGFHGLEPVRADAGGAAVPAGRGVMPIVFIGARPGEKLHEELAFEAEWMQPTRHPHINTWLLEPPGESPVRAMLETLDPRRRDPDPAAIAEAIRGLVPGMTTPVAA